MKKIVIFLIIILSFSFVSVVKAEAGDITGFSCQYNPSIPGAESFTFSIEVTYYYGFNDKTGGGTISYINNSGGTSTITEAKTVTDTPTNTDVDFLFEHSGLDRYINIFNGKDCPKLYWYKSTKNNKVTYHIGNDASDFLIDWNNARTIYSACPGSDSPEKKKTCAYAAGEVAITGKKIYSVEKETVCSNGIDLTPNVGERKEEHIINIKKQIDTIGNMYYKINYDNSDYKELTFDGTAFSPLANDGSNRVIYIGPDVLERIAKNGSDGGKCVPALYVTLDKVDYRKYYVTDSMEDAQNHDAGTGVDKSDTTESDFEYDPIDWIIDDTQMTCEEILGPVLTKVLRGIITVMQILAGIIALVKGMIIFIPPILSKDSDALKKASKTLVTLLIVLAVVIAFRPVIRLFGSILGYDISCFM